MSLTVETGGIIPGAESYESVTNADLYHSNRGNTAWAALNTAAKEQALRKATDYLTQSYRSRWKGHRTDVDQALDWPRKYVYLSDYETSEEVASDTIPNEIKAACSELALRASADDLAPDLDPAVTSEAIGTLSVAYAAGTSQVTTYRAIDMMLKPYLRSGGAGVQIIRS
jgi:hypothetical protein